jgi:hypothetical protein
MVYLIRSACNINQGCTQEGWSHELFANMFGEAKGLPPAFDGEIDVLYGMRCLLPFVCTSAFLCCE